MVGALFCVPEKLWWWYDNELTLDVCRFSSSKSGRIYLHTDIRMIIFRKSDMDTAAAHHNNNNSSNNNNNLISSGNIFDSGYEMRSFTDGPENPKFSPRWQLSAFGSLLV